MLKNKKALIEHLSAQMNELSCTLPPKNQSHTPNLNKNEHAEYSTIQEEINTVINYEHMFLALRKRE